MTRTTRQITAFKISYSAHNPRVAQQVTTELTNLFISENLKVRQQQSEGTTKFIEDQLEEARVTLSQQEAKVRQFQGSTKACCRRNKPAIFKS